MDIRGPRFDLHSGSFGGIIYNPAQVLVDILQKLKNPDGTVALPGFYDDALAPENWEREEMASLTVDIQSLKDYLGVSELTGEPGYSVLERRTARPTLDINGLWGGFSGEGAKTIIPAKAGAKVSMRLVPNQVPEKIDRLFHQFVTANCPHGVSAKITTLHGADPVLVPRNTPAMLAAEKAIEIGFGKKPVFIREGGSIPVVNMIKKHHHRRTSCSWAGEARTTVLILPTNDFTSKIFIEESARQSPFSMKWRDKGRSDIKSWIKHSLRLFGWVHKPLKPVERFLFFVFDKNNADSAIPGVIRPSR